MSTDSSDGIEIAVMRILCKRFKSNFSLLVRESLSGFGSSYLDLEIDPNDYKDAALFSRDYLLYSFLRKWIGWGSLRDTKQAAISSWTTAERTNLLTNLRFSDDDSHDFRALLLISKIKRKIESIIGLEPDLDVIMRLCKWGPGATYDIKRNSLTDAPTKMSGELSVTPDAVKYFDMVDDPVWKAYRRGSLCITRGNRCVTVPKNAKTDRMIAAEPTVNSFLQQGAGRYIRSRLLAFGVDLNDQSVNQDLAFRALVEDYSTIDLSMASDSLSSSVVSLLLPIGWYTFLDDIRSRFSYLDNKWYRLEKFSSMGNAFTFELETLIFFAICKVICGEGQLVSVYGDDIIIPGAHYDDVVAALRYFGFAINNDKSYTTGSCFFESCGRHYHSLEDVTPVYQKAFVETNLSELIRLHNRLYRWGCRNGMHLVKDALAAVIAFTSKSHPKLRRLPRTPNIEADMGFISDISSFKRDRHGDFRCDVLIASQRFWYYIDTHDIGCGLAYKLRHSRTLNPEPDGSCCVILETSFRLRTKKVWASSLV